MPAFIANTALPIRSHAPLLAHHSHRLHCNHHLNRVPVTLTMSLESHLSRRSFTLAVMSALALPLLPTTAQVVAPPSAPSSDAPSRVAAATALRRAVATAIGKDPTLAATLLRLAFHDSFTFDLVAGRGGANGSIRFETARPENFGLQRAVEALTPIVDATALGWGDAVAVAGAVAVEETGGPFIDVRLGRDNAARDDPIGILPSLADSVDELRARFVPRGFNDRDIVALSGAHTLGRVGGGGPFVAEPNTFKNDYFKNLLWYQNQIEQGFSTKTGPPKRPNFQLPSDMHLLDDPKTLAIVREFGADEKAFFDQFVTSYKKMVNVGTPFASES